MVKGAIKKQASKIPVMMEAAGAAGYGPAGATVGRMVGGALARKVAQLVGSGDYYLNDAPVVNSLIPGSANMRVDASFRTDSYQRVTFREYITDIVSSGSPDFDIRTVTIQPGLSASFPYLSNVANAYETYKLGGLVYEFVSMVSPYATSAMGSIMMTATYNTTSYPPTTRSSLENMNGCIAFRPDRNGMYGFECEKMIQNEYFVRSGDTLTPNNLEDAGKFYIATAGLSPTQYPAGTVLGELWVSYDVYLYKHRIPLLIPGYADCRRSGVNRTIPIGSDFDSNWNPPVFLGAAFPVQFSGGNVIRLFGSDDTNLGSMPPGMVVAIDCTYTCSAAGTLTFPSPTATNCNVLEKYGYDFTDQSFSVNQRITLQLKVQTVGVRAYLTFPAITTTGTAQVNYNIIKIYTVGTTGTYTSGTTY